MSARPVPSPDAVRSQQVRFCQRGPNKAQRVCIQGASIKWKHELSVCEKSRLETKNIVVGAGSAPESKGNKIS
ncbi:hypothetical protein ACJ72_08676 [Emergomyces africanus]|uniref:Uncharacterized protein n=1 Tax=Emergomyces africanus TaxID=1955775 RepID=A0A1B7NK42_9EURO|nr:hypothetical protein ACJ72_08676 [Emergomyces africanus]